MSRRFLMASLAISLFLCTGLVGAPLSKHQQRLPDFDGDGIGDFTSWRLPSSGQVTVPTFYFMTSGTNYAAASTQAHALGSTVDVPVVADYDGDGKSDLAVFRPVTPYTWSIRLASGNFATTTSVQWGLDQDVAFPADYDGDGKADLGVYRASDNNWYVLQAGTNFSSAFSIRWGVSGGTPLNGDFDGDGRLDVGFYYFNGDNDGLGAWYFLQGGTGFRTAFKAKLGGVNDVPAHGDFDGDGKTDLGVWNPVANTFTVRYAAGGYLNGLTRSLGTSADGDSPVIADYDSDGKSDLGVYRPSTGTYYVLLSTLSFNTIGTRTMSVGGTATDQAVMAR